MPLYDGEESATLASPGKTLILVENLSVPFDRRVWQEARSLREAGYGVTIVCPQGRERDSERHVVLDGIDIHRYPLRTANGGAVSYAREYGSAFYRTASLVWRLDRQARFDVVHACNPPDGLLLTALPLRRRGVAFVFDHHDLVPELYISRFGREGPLHRGTLAAERVAFRLADVVLSTNESYRRVALTRGRKCAEDVFVVRSAPSADRFRTVAAEPSLRRGKRHLLAYLGVMGPQDGVDQALRALAELKRQRDDWYGVFIGSGDVFDEMRTLVAELELGDHVEFTGRIPDEDVVRFLSTADVCLSPDPMNPLNDVSTMNKVVEYMALSRPIVSYNLAEARVSAGDAALYATPNDVVDFARCISRLLDSPAERDQMGKAGRLRFEQEISWQCSEDQLLAAYERAIDRRRRRRRR
jgi:glycosyltransferase involved in cell wall biosynthesis